jgi:acyl CoA:acetate/3-ketoacid CoA transferase beta subunit
VIEVRPEGLVLLEVAPGVTTEDMQKATEPALHRAPTLKTMAL